MVWNTSIECSFQSYPSWKYQKHAVITIYLDTAIQKFRLQSSEIFNLEGAAFFRVFEELIIRKEIHFWKKDFGCIKPRKLVKYFKKHQKVFWAI